MTMKEDSDSAGLVGTVGEPITGTMAPLSFDADLYNNPNKLIADGLVALDKLARIQITLTKHESNVGCAPLLTDIRSIIKRG